MHVSKLKKQRGFTLVELAISLMVIGLLLGGVLKGRELIDNAKITATARQLNEYHAATMVFFNTYGEYPGDMKQPGMVLPDCADDAWCSLGGDGDGRVDDGESRAFFPHLKYAGLISEKLDGTEASNNGPEEEMLYAPMTPVGYRIGVTYVRLEELDEYNIDSRKHVIQGRHYWVLDKPIDDEGSWVSPKIMRALDEKMDDGRPLSGSVVVSQAETECPINIAANEYDLDYSDSWQECHFMIGAGF